MFWIIIAILIAIAIAFILPALLKKEAVPDATREQNIAIAKEQLAEIELRFKKNELDQNNYQIIKEELERSLYNDLKESDFDVSKVTNTNSSITSNKRPSKSVDTWLILLLAPVIAIPVYLSLGNLNFTKQLDSKKAAQEIAKSTMPLNPDGSPDIEKISERLKLEMERNPTDPKGWYMLGRSYMLIQRFEEATESFEKSLSLRPDLAETMLSLADALSMQNNGLLIGRPRALVNKALSIEPSNITALWLSGMAASQEGEYPEAIQQWQKVLPFIENKPEEKETVLGLIADAKSRLDPNASEEVPVNNSSATQSQTKEIKVQVTLSEKFKAKVSPNDLVFVYAKAVSGPPMPLAAIRKQVKDFPLEVILNDEKAMMPSLKLSSFKQVIVGARISRDGQAIAKNGDLFAEKINISLGEKVSLEINDVYQK